MTEEVVDAEVVEQNQVPEERGPLKIAVIGLEDDPLTAGTVRAFNAPRGVEVTTWTSEPEDIDALIEEKPAIVFWCDPITVKKNDTQDDSVLIGSLQRILRGCGSGVCIRSSINVDTFERLMMSLTKQVVDNKIVYMPDLTDSANLSDHITPPIQILGGSPEVIKAHMEIIQNATWFSAEELKVTSFAEAVYVKLATTGYRLVQQKFFDELHEAVMDMKNANPMVVSRIVRSTLGVSNVPSHVSSGLCYDARIFTGGTDTLSLIESCLEK